MNPHSGITYDSLCVNPTSSELTNSATAIRRFVVFVRWLFRNTPAFEKSERDVVRTWFPAGVKIGDILAYNLIRTIIAQAASKHDLKPRSISFKGAIQSLEAFQPLIALQGERDAAFRRSLYEQLLDAIATHSVADRPNRFEPRLRKRRQKKYDRMMKPRNEIKRDILKRLKEN